jgi:hypothetical protein
MLGPAITLVRLAISSSVGCGVSGQQMTRLALPLLDEATLADTRRGPRHDRRLDGRR